MAHTWTSSNPSLTIPETTNVKFRGEVWTVYKMKVVDGERSFFVEKRFNAFVQFHDILAQAFGAAILPKFPKASFFENKFDPGVIARRRKELENYMNTLLTDERFLNSIYLREFLQPPPQVVANPLSSQPPTFPQQPPAYNSQPYAAPYGQPTLQVSYQSQQPVYQQPPFGQHFGAPPMVQQGYYQQQQGYYQQPIQPPLPGSLYQQPLPQPLPNQTFAPPPIPPHTKIPDRFVHSGQQISLNAILQEACRNFTYLSTLETELSLYQSLHNERIELIKKNSAELANVSSLFTIELEILERIAASLQTVSVNAALYIISYCSVIEQARKFAQDLLLESQDEMIPPELREVEGVSDHQQDPNNDYPNLVEAREVLSVLDHPLPDLQLNQPQFHQEQPAHPPAVEEVPHHNVDVEAANERSENDIADLASFIEEFNKLNVKVENLLIEATHTNDPKTIINILQQDKETARALLDKYSSEESQHFAATSGQLRTLIAEMDNTSKLLATRQQQQQSRPKNRLQFVQEKVYKYLPYLEKDLSDSEYTKIREKLKLLNKELSTLKQGEHKYPIAELEELQTILSDLLFKLDEKFKPEISTAKQMAKDFQLKKAKEGHKAIEDEMFGL